MLRKVLLCFWISVKTFNVILFLATCAKEKRNLIHISELADDYGAEFYETILGLHMCSDEDTKCAFKGKGKFRPFKKLKELPRYQSVLCRLDKE